MDLVAEDANRIHLRYLTWRCAQSEGQTMPTEC